MSRLPIVNSDDGTWGTILNEYLTDLANDLLSIENMATLRTLIGNQYQTVVLDGYYTTDDGGGGTFIWSDEVAADDGGIVVNPSGGTAAGWRRLFDGAVNVKWFGADSSGNFDCAAAIQKAINSTSYKSFQESFPRDVFLPTGYYRVKSTLTCSILRNGSLFGVNICGAGKYNTLIYIDADTSTDGLVYEALAQYGMGGSLRDLRIAGFDLGEGRDKVRDLLVVGNWNGFTCDNIIVENAGNNNLTVYGGIYLSFSNSSFVVSGNHNLEIGRSEIYPLGSTTVFKSCVFDCAAHQGAYINNGQLDVDFYSCTFQSSGRILPEIDLENGVGIEAIDGIVSLYSPYFEANPVADGYFGIDPGSSAYVGLAVTIIQPKLFAGATDIVEKIGFRFNRVVPSTVIGGTYPSTYMFPMVMDGNAQVNVIGFPFGVNAGWPGQLASGGGWEPITRNTDGMPGQMRRHWTTVEATPGTILADGYTTISAPFVFRGGPLSWWLAYGDVVTVSYDKLLPNGVVLFGAVTSEADGGLDLDGGGIATVTLYNCSSTSAEILDGYAYVEVVKKE